MTSWLLQNFKHRNCKWLWKFYPERNYHRQCFELFVQQTTTSLKTKHKSPALWGRLNEAKNHSKKATFSQRSTPSPALGRSLCSWCTWDFRRTSATILAVSKSSLKEIRFKRRDLPKRKNRNLTFWKGFLSKIGNHRFTSNRFPKWTSPSYLHHFSHLGHLAFSSLRHGGQTGGWHCFVIG